MQRGGNRLRVNVQLIDAETGNHLWAERFEKPVADLFDMQDEIVSRLANTLDAQLIEVEARRAVRSTDPDAMDLYFQGWACANNGTTEAYMTQAHAFFDRALALDPGNIEALVGSARVKAAIGANLTRDDWTAQFAAAEAAVTRALSLAPNHARAHSVLGFVQTHTSRPAQGIAECERALALDRNLADAHGFIGLAKHYLARGEETEGYIHEAFRLSPRDNNAYRWLMFVGIAKLSDRRGRLATPEHRGQPKSSRSALVSRRCTGVPRFTRRGAGRRAGRPCAQSDLHHPPLPSSRDKPPSEVGRRAQADV